MQTRTDSSGNPIDARGVPTGPIEAEPAAAYDDDGRFKGNQAHEEILLAALAEAGVELGAYDRRMAAHMAVMFDWPMMGTVASWITRAHTSDD